MRFLISVAVVVLTAASVQAQTKQEEIQAIRQKIAALQERIDKLSSEKKVEDYFIDYWLASDDAVVKKRPLVVFLGSFVRPVKGATVCAVDSLTGYSAPAVVVCTQRGNELVSFTRPGDSTDDEIAETIAKLRQEVSRPANPFDIKSYKSQPLVGPDGSSLLPVGSVDAMDELNAQRARRGLFPFIRDDLLTIAAARAAAFRAPRLMSGHCPNDFVHVPAGGFADAAGCAAWSPTTVTTTGETFGACATDSTQYRYAGAAWVWGSDGLRYSHAFYRK